MTFVCYFGTKINNETHKKKKLSTSLLSTTKYVAFSMLGVLVVSSSVLGKAQIDTSVRDYAMYVYF